MRSIAIAIAVALLLAVSPCACRKPTRREAKSPRIVTFAPHITDIAFDMGLGEHVVGVTRFCLVPAGEDRPVMGDRMRVNAEALLAEEPDIIFHNQDPADFDGILTLDSSIKLIRMRNGTLAELRAGIEAMGRAVDRQDLAAAVLERMDAEFAAVAKAVAGRGRPRVLFVRGTEHPGTPGGDRLTGELLIRAGGRNVAAEAGLKGWPRINLGTIIAQAPDVLICQAIGGGESIEQARRYWADKTDIKAVADGRLHITDDRRLTIPGSKVAETARKLAAMIHPEAFAPERQE